MKVRITIGLVSVDMSRVREFLLADVASVIFLAPVNPFDVTCQIGFQSELCVANRALKHLKLHFVVFLYSSKGRWTSIASKCRFIQSVLLSRARCDHLESIKVENESFKKYVAIEWY